MATAGPGRTYHEPAADCDVVLKGGVTSGIVYPLAICELATAYRLRRIGGTSSGAIVGAFAAAAECHRQAEAADRAPPPPGTPADLPPGFPGLERFARAIEEPGRLLNVFLPDARTAPMFDVLFPGARTAAPGTAAPAPTVARRLGALVAQVPRALPLAAAAAALGIALALAWTVPARVDALLATGDADDRLRADLLAFAAIVALLAAPLAAGAAGAALALWRRVTREWIPAFVANDYGLARGLGAADARSDGPEPYALTTWMTRIVNELAGRAATGPPLTFGDLWRADGVGTAAAPAVGFELVTTCITLGRPLRLPFDLARRRGPPFHFDPEEWRRFFPERVVRHCCDHSPSRERPRWRDPSRPGVGPAYYELPAPEDLPVVVATRLSVALPGVLSAMPLWSVDTNAADVADASDAADHGGHAGRPLERCWCTDGGVSSNFPVHFFDQLLPRWPTFAIDLRPAPPSYGIDPADPAKNVWMPLTNDAGRTEWWNRLAGDAASGPADPAGSARSVVQFVEALVRTMQGWRDTALAHETGYRDRIAHVKLDPEREGGLNIAMPPDVVSALVERGAAVGALLRHRYTIDEAKLDEENRETWDHLPDDRRERWETTTVSWANHRWLRFRTTMAALQDALERMEDAYPDYAALVTRLQTEPPRDYRWSAEQRTANPAEATARLLAAIRAWREAAPPVRFGDGEMPDPRPELRLWPRL